MGLNRITFDIKLFTDAFDDAPRSRRALGFLLEALTQVNAGWIISRGSTVPLLFNSGVVYRSENGKEQWQDIPTTMARGYGDCEDLACWRAAELRVAGVRAKPHLKWRETPDGVALYHVTVMLPDGSVEDPSKSLGMNGHPMVAREVYVDP